MIRLFQYLLVGFATFMIGVMLVYDHVTFTTLEEITRNIGHYEGRVVEVETFAQTDQDFGWTIGEPFDKYERLTFIEFRNASNELDALRHNMASQSSLETYPRLRVRVRGTVEDHCNDDGIVRCCFGETMTLKEASVKVLSPPEMYSRPERN